MDINYLEILKIGFSGFAFLLALLSFRLLATEQKRKEPRIILVNAIHFFMKFSIILGVLTAITPFLPQIFEKKEDPFMQAMLESTKNRKPLPLEFVKSQISVLTAGHEKRLDDLYQQRNKLTYELKSGNFTFENTRELEGHIRRVDQYIRQENRNFESNVSKFRNML